MTSSLSRLVSPTISRGWAKFLHDARKTCLRKRCFWKASGPQWGSSPNAWVLFLANVFIQSQCCRIQCGFWSIKTVQRRCRHVQGRQESKSKTKSPRNQVGTGLSVRHIRAQNVETGQQSWTDGFFLDVGRITSKVANIGPLFYLLGFIGTVQFGLLMWVHMKHLGLAGLNPVMLVPLLCRGTA